MPEIKENEYIPQPQPKYDTMVVGPEGRKFYDKHGREVDEKTGRPIDEVVVPKRPPGRPRKEQIPSE